jgi:dihydroorotase
VDALKEHACGCAGCFTATNTMPLLVHIFEEEGALNRLEAFTSQNGAAFYGLPQNEAMITLVKSAQATVFPPKIPSESGPVTVFDPGFAVHWHVQA